MLVILHTNLCPSQFCGLLQELDCPTPISTNQVLVAATTEALCAVTRTARDPTACLNTSVTACKLVSVLQPGVSHGKHSHDLLCRTVCSYWSIAPIDQFPSDPHRIMHPPLCPSWCKHPTEPMTFKGDNTFLHYASSPALPATLTVAS